MITKIEINNYKSLHKLELESGRITVLIGENGCGKSNILEALTFASAAEANKLDNEFLVSRGIRVTDPQLMRSAFNINSQEKNIEINLNFSEDDKSKKYKLAHDNEPYSTWNRKENPRLKKAKTHLIRLLEETSDDLSNEEIHNENSLNISTIIEPLESREITELLDHFLNDKNDFIIYSPENTSLRIFSKEGQIQPLGINGEGLLKLLKVIQQQSESSEQKPTPLDEIKQCLELFDWFESIEISSDLLQSEQKVTLKDRYLEDVFDQRSANEGFLFVLFYLALLVSKDTPKIFAIDNIDASLNPKLCTKLIKELTRLAKKYNKQIFVTTHNPAILDGIDLGDDEQRLIVVSRNKQGHTRCKRIELKDKPKSSTNEPLKLSEAFLRGYLGGLPKGF